MTEQNQTTFDKASLPALGMHVLIGTGIALTVILFFILQADNPPPEWGELWMIRPLIVTPLAGAAGGAFFYLMSIISYHGGWRRVLALTMGALVYLVGLWMGIVLGLVGTMWH